ncbi:MAG: hypothetical protein ABI475_05245 [Methylophilaceae bacterium]
MANRILVATRKGLFDIRQHVPGHWAIHNKCFLGEQVGMVLHDPHDGALYASLELGHFGTKLHRSDDDGMHWQEISAPSYASVNSGEAPSLKMVWSMEVGAPGTLWAGTIPGGLFKSSDRGASWELTQSLWDDPLRKQWLGGGYDEPGIHSICVDPRDPNRIAIGVSCGGVWLSEDNGVSWRTATKGLWADYMPPGQEENPAIQDPHRLVQCYQVPDNFWIQHHNGIFRSTDGCAHWTRIKAQPSSFGFAVAVHPQQPDTAWFVPAVKDDKRYPVNAKFIVTRTHDGGKTFSSLTTGLPQQESYDLVYRHGLAVDERGVCLAMASTTGNFWISENGGEAWSEFTNHFPQVYAVRFVQG